MRTTGLTTRPVARALHTLAVAQFVTAACEHRERVPFRGSGSQGARVLSRPFVSLAAAKHSIVDTETRRRALQKTPARYSLTTPSSIHVQTGQLHLFSHTGSGAGYVHPPRSPS